MRPVADAAIALALALASILFCRPGDGRAADLFAATSFANQGRSVAAELADLNGDGRPDLFVVTLLGVPPLETRTIHVYLQQQDGSFPAAASHTVQLPHWSAVYDVADVRSDSPGEEMVLLRPDGVTLLSLADGSGKSWELAAPGPTTVGVAADERGFEPFRLVFRDFGPEPWILVPQIGQLVALSPEGELRAKLALARRANYFIIPATGLVSLESDFQIFLDVPKLMLGDVDGDGRTDIVSTTRHEVRVFLRGEDGGFPFGPSRSLPLKLVTPRDHIRGSGGVASDARDIDGDGLLDLLITHTQGSFSDATTRTFVYMNRKGEWNLDAPDQILTTKASLSSNALYDVDQDGLFELLRIEFSFSLLEVVELLLSREIDIDIAVFRFAKGEGFAEKPWVERKISVPFTFETFRPKGFIPVANVDVNADGYLDFVSSGGGRSVEVLLGSKEGAFSTRGGTQSMPTAGVIHFADYDRDGLQDFVIFDPHNFDVPVRLWRNQGLLPGTPSAIRARD